MDTLTSKLNKLIDKADGSVPPKNQELWKRAIRFAKENSELLQNPAVQYSLGYAWYNIQEDSKERDECVEKFLLNAIGINKKDWYAITYIGHFYYDKQRYLDALMMFVRIPKNAFSEQGQSWRDLKVKELCACCYLYLNQLDDFKAELEALFLQATFCDESDICSIFELPELLCNLITKQRT